MSPVAKNHRPVWQTELLEDLLGIRRERLKFVVALLRSRELDEFHLLKLMLADDAAHVAAIRTRFTSEARRIRREPERKLVAIDRLVAEQVRDGNLGRRSQPEVRPLALEQILRELREADRFRTSLPS